MMNEKEDIYKILTKEGEPLKVKMIPDPENNQMTPIRGTVVATENSRYGYISKIWFDYLPGIINSIREGDFLIVESFGSQRNVNRYEGTLLQIVNLLPTHASLVGVDEESSHPIFIREFMDNIKEDWENKRKTKDLFVRVVAAPLGYVLTKFGNGNRRRRRAMTKPLLGHDVFILSPEEISNFYNETDSGRMINELFKASPVGTLISDYQEMKEDDAAPEEKRDIYLNFDKMVKYHFGVFAHTGHGKSVTISSLIKKLLEYDKEEEERKTQKKTAVIFDLSEEYPILLSNSVKRFEINFVFPEPLDIPVNKDDLTDKFVVPDELANYKEKIADLLWNHCRFLALFSHHDLDERMISLEETEKEILDRYKYREMPKTVQSALNNLRNLVENYKEIDFDSLKKGEAIQEKFHYLVKEVLNIWEAKLKLTKERIENYNTCGIPLKKNLSFQNLLEEMICENGSEWIDNEKEFKNRIYIFLCADVDLMRKIVAETLTKSLEMRRKKKIKDLVLFVIDEAHEYIPSSTSDEIQKWASKSVENLVRQGRKYALGCCIATQRTRLLNTSIIGQLHTYFIGTLPRKEDRAVISDAFLVDEEILLRTLSFEPGQWLVASYNATGVKNMPVSIYVENELIKIKNSIGEKKKESWLVSVIKNKGTKVNGEPSEVFIIFRYDYDEISDDIVSIGIGLHSRELFGFPSKSFPDFNIFDVWRIRLTKNSKICLENLYDGEHKEGKKKFNFCLLCDNKKKLNDKPFHYHCWSALREEFNLKLENMLYEK